MPFFKVIKEFRFTEDVYVEAETESEACDKSGYEDGVDNNDTVWYSAHAIEITEDDYKYENS